MQKAQMLYQFYRYIIGLGAAFSVGVSLILFVYLSDPTGFPALGATRTFEPIMTLFYIFCVTLSLLSILFTHPFVTDGDETLSMKSPLSHAAVQSNIVLMLTLIVLQLSAFDSTAEFATRKVIEATAFLLKVNAAALIASVAGFFAIRHRAKIMYKRGLETNAFCVETSFRGL